MAFQASFMCEVRFKMSEVSNGSATVSTTGSTSSTDLRSDRTLFRAGKATSPIKAPRFLERRQAVSRAQRCEGATPCIASNVDRFWQCSLRGLRLRVLGTRLAPPAARLALDDSS